MTDTNNTDGAALLPVTQSDGDLTLALIDSLECSTDAPDAPEWAAKFREELADRGFIIARHRPATQEDAERSVAVTQADRDFAEKLIEACIDGPDWSFDWEIAHQMVANYRSSSAERVASTAALWKVHDALVAHHQWHAAQTTPDPEYGFVPADEYADSGLYEQTVAAICALDPFLRSGPRDTAALSTPQRQEYDGEAGETLESIIAWGDQTFGPCSQDRAIERAGEEWSEMEEDDADVPIEAADVIICLLRIPGILDAINRKMTINRGRTWDVRPDGTGYHVKAAALPSHKGAE